MRKRVKYILLSLVRKKFLWTILAFILIVGFLDANSFWNNYKLEQENARLREEITNYEQRYAASTKELQELQSSPEAIERVARVNLYMKTTNEDIYIIE